MAASPQRRGGFLPSSPSGLSFSSLRKGQSRFSKALPSVPVEEAPEGAAPKQLPELVAASSSSSKVKRKPLASSPAGEKSRATPPWRSPTYSLSSLLSAYGAGGSPVSTAPSSAPSPPLLPSGKLQAASSSPIQAQQAQPPPWRASTAKPPPPDDKTLPPTPPANTLATSSPPRPDTWRRRSHKPESLLLSHSHGSTATSTSTSTSSSSDSPPPASPPLPHAASPPVTQQPGAAGSRVTKEKKTKKKKKTTSKTTSPKGEKQAMGSESSKLSLVKKTLHRHRSAIEDAGSAAIKTKTIKAKTESLPARPAAQRPPTPEYGIGDGAAAPADDTFVSPVSPAPSESPTTVQAQLDAKASPDQRIPSRKPVPLSAPSLDALTDMQGLDGVAGQSPPPPPSPAGYHHPMGGWSFRASDSTESVGLMGPRSVSSRVDLQRQDTERPRRPTADGDPRMVHSESQGLLFRGRDGTLYPEMKVTREPHESASYFPIQADKPPEPGAIIPAGPLKDSHYGCYQGHRTMNRRQNKYYPLTCQTCDKADTEDRWGCTFCNLRICEACMRALNGHHRVLRRLVDELALNTPLSLSSMSRPGSALGMPPGKLF
ncbi:hypothetical protein XA68_14441 [Ophiocordyceps unilateralis]|uniref:Uncharacterized protein n=1 Tax=Ophiocordyceps unilateralis TaxID=268505 RepID=A0A2A9P8Z3_OPHUN|nr:hypothetical protein XA68_14441 [Ophiocordyceps unilateralis]